MVDYTPSEPNPEARKSSLTPQMIAALKAAQERYKPSAQQLAENAERRRQYERRKEAAARSEPLPGHTSYRNRGR
ncbi:hypothetical protein [Corynebacterium sp. MSK195]|uniref:hypothetical protein n=1 Tax=Corynebacterium sp. MSK195 TaxID=3050216 RepID=UPI0025501943|nr:hypothetical protein [Corynebacterium sp. MSK195]MDK8670267.1 hypothetical protein [Corynebacterium sp. MSK195]